MLQPNTMNWGAYTTAFVSHGLEARKSEVKAQQDLVPAFWLIDGHIFAVSSHGLPLEHGPGGSKVSLPSL